MPEWMNLDNLSKLGDFLTGLGALGAIVVAAFGVRTWRTQKRQEQQGTAAAETLRAALTACNAIARYLGQTSVVSRSSEWKDATPELLAPLARVLDEFTAGGAGETEEDVRRLFAIGVSAEMFLPRDSYVSMFKLVGIFDRYRLTYQTWIALAKDKGVVPPQVDQELKRVVEETMASLDAVRKELHDRLQPMVQLSSWVTPRPIG